MDPEFSPAGTGRRSRPLRHHGLPPGSSPAGRCPMNPKEAGSEPRTPSEPPIPGSENLRHRGPLARTVEAVRNAAEKFFLGPAEAADPLRELYRLVAELPQEKPDVVVLLHKEPIAPEAWLGTGNTNIRLVTIRPEDWHRHKSFVAIPAESVPPCSASPGVSTTLDTPGQNAPRSDSAPEPGSSGIHPQSSPEAATPAN